MRQLTQREKILVIVLGISIAVVIVYYIVTASPASNSSGNTGDITSQMNRLSQLSEEYKQLRNDRVRYQSLLSSNSENTATLIQQISASNNIDKNIVYTKRNQSNIQNKYIKVTTDIKIEGVSIQPLINFLSEIDKSEGLIIISYLRINAALKGTGTYDALIKIDSYTGK